MVLNGEVGGDQGWNLTSDICGVDLRAMFGLVVLNHLGLQNTPVPCSILTDAVCRREHISPRWLAAPLTVLGIESGSTFF